MVREKARTNQGETTMPTYYAATNSYADDFSVGFSNTWNVMAFDSKAARDAFVASRTDAATRAIPKREVTKYASNWNNLKNEYNRPKPFSCEYWGIVDDLLEYSPHGAPDGYLGTVEVCDDYSPCVRRVYG